MADVIRVGLLGLGTVGLGFLKMFERNKACCELRVGRAVSIEKIAVNDLTKARTDLVKQYQLTDDAMHICQDPTIDVVVELIGGIEPAKSYVTAAIKAGKRIVTANKALLAEASREMFDLAKQQQGAIYCEAAVAGGIPIIHVLHAHLFSDSIKRLEAILNGTSHYILSEMCDKHEDFDVALERAKQLGYAESDPLHDVELIDATHKLAILAELAFKKSLDWKTIPRFGISNIRYLDMRYARQFNACIKPVAFMQAMDDGRLLAHVEPMLVPLSHELASCHGVMNAIYLESQHCDKTLFVGPGAGADPTATSVLADLIRACRKEPFDVAAENAVLVSPEDNPHQTECYIRMIAKHEIGILARLAETLSDCGVSIKEIHQNQKELSLAQDEKLIVILTEPIGEPQFNLLKQKLDQTFPKEAKVLLRIVAESV